MGSLTRRNGGPQVKGARAAYYERPTYLAWIRSEATLIDTDGCSSVSGLRMDCCLEHDVSFFFGKDPRDAYRHERTGSYMPWEDAAPITFDEANRRFRKCHQVRSKFGQWSPMAWWRWAGVALFSREAWERHRIRAERVQDI